MITSVLKMNLLFRSLSSARSGGENSRDFVRALDPVTSKACGFSPSLPDAGGRRGPGRGGVFSGWPLSPALSPLVPRGEREKTSGPLPVAGSGAQRAGEEALWFMVAKQVRWKRQRRGSYQPGPTAQEKPTRRASGLKARFKSFHGSFDRHGAGFQPFTIGRHGIWAVGPGWYGDGPLALQETKVTECN